MGYQVVLRVEPVKSVVSLSRAQAHWIRRHIEEHVDSKRSHLNQVLFGHGHPSEDVPLVTEKYRMANRRGPIAADLIMSAAKEYFDESFSGWDSDPSLLNPWVESSMEFLKNKYGEGLASAVIHLDEEAPHIHAMIVPLTETISKNRFGEKKAIKVNYTKLFGDSPKVLLQARKSGSSDDTKLGKLQSEYAIAMRHLGLERGIRKSLKKHMTPRDYRNFINSVPAVNPPKDLLLRKDDFKTPVIKKGEAIKIVLGGDIPQRIEDVHDKVIKNRNFYLEASKSIAAFDVENKKLREENEMLKEEVKQAREAEQNATLELRSHQEYVSALRALSVDAVCKKLDISDTDKCSYLLKLGEKKFNAVNMVMNLEKLSFNDAVLLLSDHFPVNEVCTSASEYFSNSIKNTLEKHESPSPGILIKRNPSRAEILKGELIRKETDGLQADKYRITLTSEILPSFNLGKQKDGTEKFYKSSEIIDLIPHLSHHNARGYNVCLTPFSDQYQYILVDDLRDKERFLKEYSPSVIQHSSPSSEQAILIVQKQDHAAENEFFKKVNMEFGDPKISGVTHPFRLAGFTNQKPKHRQTNGRQPFVKIDYTEFRICTKTFQEIQKIMEEFQLPEGGKDIGTLLELESRKNQPKMELHLGQGKIDKYIELYQKNLDYYGERADLSRIDYAIAISMLKDGCQPIMIAETLEAISPDINLRHPQIEKYLERQIAAASNIAFGGHKM
ncbi:MAG: MobV family relaxase [Leptospirillum sp.]